MGVWIPNVTGRELPGTRQFHLEMTNQQTATVELVLQQVDLQAAYFWGLREGGVTHPQNESLHLSSIDVSFDYPKEYWGNSQEWYQDECVKATLNYKEWQIPNQGYESSLENIGQVFTIPMRGVYWGRFDSPNLVNFAEPVWHCPSMYIRRGNLRLIRKYTGRTKSPIYIMDYHNTLNSVAIPVPEWGFSIAPEWGLFTVGQFSRNYTRDFSSPDPLAMIDMYTYSYSIEIMQGGWNVFHHPVTGNLRRIFDRMGNPVSLYPTENWDIAGLL